MDGDDDADYADVTELVEQIFGTWRGDVNLDGLVSAADLTTVITNWGMSPATWAQGDVTSDGAVGAPDYTTVQTNWGLENEEFSLVTLSADPAWD